MNDNQDDLWGSAPTEDLPGDAADEGPDLFGDSPAAAAAEAEPAVTGKAAGAAEEPVFSPGTPSAAKAQTDGYVVLARKYRPQTFDDLVGQDSVQQALRGAIATGQISHAYLFSGPRGTGKTSTARILAKAVNCQNGGPRPDPCGKCSSCRSITAGSSLDVIEIDAASNTGVDNIRDLKSGVVLAPFSRYKVYIVDEVHMLSNQAFNALLKTLEEPPSQVIFVLATTELHKVPETIISRCQTFMFRRFSMAELKGQLGSILDIETANRGIDVSAENRERILDLISRNAEGGMRDAQVTLDQVLVLSKGQLDFDSVRRFLGIADNEALDRFVKLLNEREPKGLLELIEHMVSQGQDLELFVKSACEHMRDLLLVRTAGRDTSLINVSEDRALELEALANAVSPAFLVNAIDLFIKLVGEMKVSGQPRIVLELAVLKLTLGGGPDGLDDVLRRLGELEARVNSGGGASAPGAGPGQQVRSQAQAAAPQQPERGTASKPERPTAAGAPASAEKVPGGIVAGAQSAETIAAEANPAPKPAVPKADLAEPGELGKAVLARIQQDAPMFYMSFEKVYRGQECDGRVLTLFIASTPKVTSTMVMRPANLEIIAAVVKELSGDSVTGRVVIRDDIEARPMPKSDGSDAKAAPRDEVSNASAGGPDRAPVSAAISPERAVQEAMTVIETEEGAGPVIYYPQEIREKAMRELKPAEFQAMLSADAKMKELVDKVKAVFGIDDKSMRFLRSTLA